MDFFFFVCFQALVYEIAASLLINTVASVIAYYEMSPSRIWEKYQPP